ncbi:MotA/TolQ/ExbB proton channel family protein [Stappia sp.]|uniref:MotA/TolQ/ExbB proton channel family protein n=1 Tax=Stappia sp. TaxID=1870903 RepID=UPI0032D8D394
MVPEDVAPFPAAFRPLADLIATGGPVVVLLLVLSVTAGAIVVAKLLQFQIAGLGRHARARAALDAWLAGRPEAARAALADRRSVAGEVLAALMRHPVGDAAARQALKEDAERICRTRLSGLASYLRALDMIAQTAPLIGLFGTVLGMIEAFRAMQGAGAAVDPSVLAGGIWVALLTTAVGLAIAIPVSAITSWFDGRLEREQVVLESLVTAFFTGAPAERVAGAEGRSGAAAVGVGHAA